MKSILCIFTLFEKIKKVMPKFPNNLSKAIQNLLELLFSKKPEGIYNKKEFFSIERLGSDGAEKIKSHPWF